MGNAAPPSDAEEIERLGQALDGLAAVEPEIQSLG